MNIDFNEEELRNLGIVLARVQVSGAEALGLVMLQQKIAGALSPPVDGQPNRAEPDAPAAVAAKDGSSAEPVPVE